MREGGFIRSRALRALAVLFAATLVVAACGDDDDSSDSGDEEALSAFCTSGPGVDAALAPEEPDPDEVETALAAAEADAPEEIADSVTTAADTVREIFETGNFDLFESEEMSEALAAIDAFYLSDCGFTDLAITAMDYSYEDVPGSVDAGNAVLTFTNDGTEVHEAIIFRINDDVDMSIEELLELPEEEAQTMVTEVGAGFSFPDDSSTAVLNLDEPGNYAIVCFIPVGATPEAAIAFEETGEEPDGPPHFTQGMVAEFEVS